MSIDLAQPISSTFSTIVPHSILDRPYWEGIRKNPRFKKLLTDTSNIARSAQERPAPPTATDYLAAKRHNNRQIMDQHWSQARGTLSSLALQKCVLGMEDTSLDDRLLNWFWCLLTEPSWTVSAHLPNNDLPGSNQPTLDLASCGMAAMFAELREVLKPWLDAVSATLADSVAAEIDTRVLTPYANGLQVGWDQPENGRVNNWLGVCAGSILTACESLAAQGLPRPDARARALEGLRHFVHDAFTQDGECDEGVSYWNYGLMFATVGWSRLTEEVFRANIDYERFRQIADYPARAHLFENCFFSGNDGSLMVNAPLDFVPWLGHTAANRFLLDWARRHPDDGRGHFCGMLRLLDSPDISNDVTEQASGNEAPLPSRTVPQYLKDQQVGMLSLSTSKGNLCGVLTGGHNNERHNHNDLGHFLITLGPKIIVPDMGKPIYTADFFGPKRYTYMVASSRGHCCPVIGEHEQRDGQAARGKMIAWSPDAEIPRLVLDLTAAYPPEAGLLGWTRSMECWPPSTATNTPGRIVFTDVFKTKKPNEKITHLVWSLYKPESHDEQHGSCGAISFRLGEVLCEFTPAPFAIAKEVYSSKELQLSENLDRKWYCLKALYRTDEKGKLSVETRFLVPQTEIQD